MTSRIVLSVDLYLKDWNGAGEVWACVQPHLIVPRPQGAPEQPSPTDPQWLAALEVELSAWLSTIDDARSHSYSLIERPSVARGQWFIPVPFAHNVDLALELSRQGAPTLPPFVNPRSRAARFVSETARNAFRDANREAAASHDDLNQPKAPPGSVPLLFAEAYTWGLKETWSRLLLQAQEDGFTRTEAARRMANVLTLAFWGGAVRRYQPQMFQGGLDPAFYMNAKVAARDAGSVAVTNLHSLCGLMFRLGSQADLSALQGVENLTVELRDNNPQPIRIASASPDVCAATTAFFQGLTPTPAQQRITCEWDASVATRVHVLDNAMAFAPISGAALAQRYRRRAGRDAKGATLNAYSLAKLKQMVVHLRTDSEARSAALPDVLEWELYDAIEATLSPYRGARLSGQGKRVLQLVPQADEADKLWAFLERSPSFLRTAQGELLGQGGAPLADLTYLGAFELPWLPARSKALLYYGKPPSDGEQVAVLLPRPLQQRLTTRRVPFDAALDAFGLRWLLDAHSLPPPADRRVEFDVLRCVSTDATFSLYWRDFVPALIFEGDVRFELAQSRDNIEGRAAVKYPQYHQPTDPQDVRPADEYAEDLINHNALNLYMQEGGAAGATRHLNPHAEIYPVGVEGTAETGRIHYFPFRYSFPHQGPSSDPSTWDEQTVRRFFSDAHAITDVPRRLSIDLEHTYGTVFHPDGGQVELPSPVDVPPALPTAVGASATTGPREHFLTVELVSGAPEQAALKLRTEWLRVPSPELPERALKEARLRHVDAWRAVAELAHAEASFLIGRFLRFDHRRGLDDSSRVALSDALEEVPELAGYERSLPASVADTCQRWLHEGAPAQDVFALATVPLDGVPGGRVGRICNVAEFWLKLRRPAGAVPSQPASTFTLVRTLPEFDQKGQKLQALTPAQDQAILRVQFPSWLASLREAKEAIEPERRQGDAKDLRDWYRQVLGGRKNDDDTPACAWLVPEDSPPNPSQVIAPIVCPVGLLPIAANRWLLDKTHALLLRYFRALSLLFDASFENDWQAPEWGTYFEKLAAKSREVRALVDRIVDDLLLPIPNHLGSRVHAPVRMLAARLRSNNDALWSALQRFVREQVLYTPAVFADAKAFMYTHLTGRQLPGGGWDVDGAAELPAEFFQVRSVKDIRDKPGGAPAERILDTDEFAFRQALLLGTPPRIAGFGELLDDARYDDDFTIREFRLRTFENVLEELRARELPGGPPPSDLNAPELQLPAGAQRNPLSGNAPAEIRLVSREPVVNPTHHATGIVAGDPTWRGTLPICSAWRLERLLQRALETPAAGQPIARVLAKKDFASQATPRRDDVLVTGIFTVRGDEESDVDVIAALRTDQFRVDCRPVSRPSPQPASAVSANADPTPPLPVATLFRTLEAQPDSAQLRAGDLLETLSADVLDFVSAALVKHVEHDPLPTGLPLVQISRGAANAINVQCPADMAVVVLRAEAGDHVPCAPAQPLRGGSLILMITLEKVVWERWSFGLIQTRNISTGSGPASGVPGEDFATEFGQISSRASDAAPYQVSGVVERIDELKPITLNSRQPRSGRQLIQELLRIARPDNLGQPVLPDEAWASLSCTVSVDRVHTASAPAEYIAPSGQRLAMEQPSSRVSMPARAPVHYLAGDNPIATDNTPVDWFAAPYRSFAVTFQWTNENNSPIFRLEGVQVLVEAP
ncbi:MAG TPA: hypothetical protein VG734_01685 [Lacunisphaera sp.]|nr:hypothetical protein [Lacunisphaera sp.]